MPDTQKFSLGATIDCLDMLHLGDELAALERAGLAELVFPIGDGEVAPFMASVEMARQISEKTNLPCHALMLTRHPERHVAACVEAGFDAMTLSQEDATHQHRILTQIREAGMSAGVAINPATSLVALDYLLDKADRVCLLGVEPWSVQEALASSALIERVKLLAENIHYRELRTQIIVYGGVDIALAGKALKAGASMITLKPHILRETGETITRDAVTKCAAALQTAVAVA